jgi:hypothetical protein
VAALEPEPAVVAAPEPVVQEEPVVQPEREPFPAPAVRSIIPEPLPSARFDVAAQNPDPAPAPEAAPTPTPAPENASAPAAETAPEPAAQTATAVLEHPVGPMPAPPEPAPDLLSALSPAAVLGESFDPERLRSEMSAASAAEPATPEIGPRALLRDHSLAVPIAACVLVGISWHLARRRH